MTRLFCLTVAAGAVLLSGSVAVAEMTAVATWNWGPASGPGGPSGMCVFAHFLLGGIRIGGILKPALAPLGSVGISRHGAMAAGPVDDASSKSATDRSKP